MLSLQLLALFGMITCLLLVVVYDRHYHSKKLKTNIIHTTIFAVIMSLVGLITFYSTYYLTQNTIAMGAEIPTVKNPLMDLQCILVAVRTAVYVASLPLIVYVFDNLRKKQ